MHKKTVLTLTILSFTLFFYQFIIHLPGAFDGSSPADFPNYYFAGKRLFEGRAIYENLENEIKQAFGWKYSVYPADTPITIALLSPLSLFEYKTAWLILVFISVITISLSIFKVCSEQEFGSQISFLLVGLALSSASSIFLLKRNHMESLILLGGVLGWLAMRCDRQNLAGLWWGIASALKLFPLLWLVAALLCGQRKTFITGLITFFLCSTVGTLIIGLANTEVFINEIIPRSKEWYGVVANYSLISLFSALFNRQTGFILGSLLSILLFLVLAKRLFNLRSHTPLVKADFIITSAFAASLLFSPLAWLNYLILIWPGLILLIKKTNFSITSERWLAISLLVTFWNWPEYITAPGYTTSVLLSSLPTFGLIYISSLKLTHR